MAGEGRFIKRKVDSAFAESTLIITDTHTGVQYLYHQLGYSGGMTVLVDADGKPLLANPRR